MRVKSKGKPYNKYAEPDRYKNMTDADKVTGVTLILMAAIIPIVVKYIEVPTGTEQQLYITKTTIDMFSYYKSVLILIGSGILLAALCAYIFSQRLKTLYSWRELITNPFFFGLLVFLLTIITSSIGSQYKYTVIHGMFERYESVFVLLSYFVIFASAFLFVRSAYQCRLLLCGLLFSCLIIGIIGAFQFFKLDFFMTPLANALVIGLNAQMHLTTPFPNQSYTTLYNPNSVGSYAALMLPVAVIGAVYYNKGVVLRVWFILCGIVTLITAIGCNSAGGLFGLAVSAVVLIVVFISLAIKKHIRMKILIGILIGLILLSVITILSPLGARIYSMTAKVFNISADKAFNTGINSDGAYFFKDIKMTGNTATVVTANGNLYFTVEQSAILVSTGADSPLTPVSSNDDKENNSTAYNYSAPGIGDFSIEAINNAFAFKMADFLLVFGVDENNNIHALSRTMQPIDLTKPVASWGFRGVESWGSGRGYIWSRTLPLIMRRPVLGSGPDSFLLVFPQDDIIGKMKFLGKPYILVDKAHNLFLQTGVNTGLISMLALLFIFVWYIVTNFFSIIKGERNEEKWVFGIRIGILAGICGYAAASLTTDGTVSVSPVFWMILGMGTALQRRAARE